MTSDSRHCDAVMLVGFGGPESSEEIRPFLDRVLAGRPIPTQRYEAVVRHYEACGGRSPYNELTRRQANALRDQLRRVGVNAPVALGLRNTPPSIGDALRSLGEAGVARVLGIVMAAHRCEASWDRYLVDVQCARKSLGINAPELEYAPSWHDHHLFVEAVAERTRDAISSLDVTDRERAQLIFTAHSIPQAMAQRSCYVEELSQSASLVAAAVGRKDWSLAFQSRSGNPREPWLEPDIRDALRQVRTGAAAVIPIGFLCDHIEVLYDLDVDAAEVAREAGVQMVRAATVSDHPKFIAMLEEIARSHLDPAPSADR